MTESHASSSSSAAAELQARPDAHSQRYDRQLRLWASSGQTSLEAARIGVLGATYLGASVLKNLVLPGIGSFDLVDGRVVDEADLGSNFFVKADAKGKSRAQEVTETLCELNPDVSGSAIVVDPAEWARNADLDLYTLIIAVNQPRSVLVTLAEKAWKAKAGVGVPLMVLRSCGLVGEMILQVKELGIVETHPESTVDLRLIQPWPELVSFARSYDMQTTDSLEHTHIPYIVLLINKLQEWRDSHSGALPEPSKDRKEFQKLINDFRWGAETDEENIDEAISALAQHVWRPISASKSGSLPEEIETLFKANSCTHISKFSSNFWLLVRALRDFVESGDGSLPLSGSLPDMKSQSATYVALQRLYRTKAKADAHRLRTIVERILVEASLPSESIGVDEIESFAKHAGFLKLIRGRRLIELEDNPDVSTIVNAFQDPINPVTVPWHIALTASQDFYSQNYKRYPGSDAELAANLAGVPLEHDSDHPEASNEEDQLNLFDLAKARLQKWKVPIDEDGEMLEQINNACQEVVRAGHSDLPNTAAFLGGTAAQEAIKLVTKQYVPLDNTAVYDGIKQAIGVFKL